MSSLVAKAPVTSLAMKVNAINVRTANLVLMAQSLARCLGYSSGEKAQAEGIRGQGTHSTVLGDAIEEARKLVSALTWAAEEVGHAREQADEEDLPSDTLLQRANALGRLLVRADGILHGIADGLGVVTASEPDESSKGPQVQDLAYLLDRCGTWLDGLDRMITDVAAFVGNVNGTTLDEDRPSAQVALRAVTRQAR